MKGFQSMDMNENGNVEFTIPGRNRAVIAKPHTHVKRASSQPEGKAMRQIDRSIER